MKGKDSMSTENMEITESTTTGDQGDDEDSHGGRTSSVRVDTTNPFHQVRYIYEAHNTSSHAYAVPRTWLKIAIVCAFIIMGVVVGSINSIDVKLLLATVAIVLALVLDRVTNFFYTKHFERVLHVRPEQ